MLKTPMRRGVASCEPTRKRIITSNRKEQNRVAAKAYRQRQKEKLQSVNTRRRGVQELRPRQGGHVASTHDVELTPESSRSQQQRTINVNLPEEILLHGSSVRDVLQHQTQDSNPIESLGPLASGSSNHQGISDSISDSDPYNLALTQPPLFGEGSQSLPSSTYLNRAESRDTMIPSPFSLPLLDLLDSEPGSNTSHPSLVPDQDTRIIEFPNSVEDDLFQLQFSSSSRISEIDDIPPTDSDLLLTHQTISTILPPDPPLANPYANCMPLWRGSAFTASLYIAFSINLNVDLIRNSWWASPFYQPTSPSSDPNFLLGAARLPYAPANLQPTLPQILFPHHAYLDLIPFPVFRARAITLASTTPPMVDLMELKADINSGLVCCNPGNGLSGGNVQPWDARSWKAAPWFVSKWRMLIS